MFHQRFKINKIKLWRKRTCPNFSFHSKLMLLK